MLNILELPSWRQGKYFPRHNAIRKILLPGRVPVFFRLDDRRFLVNFLDENFFRPAHFGRFVCRPNPEIWRKFFSSGKNADEKIFRLDENNFRPRENRKLFFFKEAKINIKNNKKWKIWCLNHFYSHFLPYHETHEGPGEGPSSYPVIPSFPNPRFSGLF